MNRLESIRLHYIRLSNKIMPKVITGYNEHIKHADCKYIVNTCNDKKEIQSLYYEANQ